MEFVDSAGTRYQLTETAEAPPPAPKKAPVWPWVVGGLDLAGGLVWMASSTSRKANPIAPTTEALILEARDPSTAWTRLEELAKHLEMDERRALLDNPSVFSIDNEVLLHTDLLQRLVEEFPEEVARHPLFVLHALIEPTDEMRWVVMKVVQRTKDVGLIERILSTWGQSWWSVREAVARNANAPEDLLRTLGNPATESHEWVREAVAWNPSTPVDLLRTLSNPATEFDAWVRSSAQKALADRGLA